MIPTSNRFDVLQDLDDHSMDISQNLTENVTNRACTILFSNDIPRSNSFSNDIPRANSALEKSDQQRPPAPKEDLTASTLSEIKAAQALCPDSYLQRPPAANDKQGIIESLSTELDQVHARNKAPSDTIQATSKPCPASSTWPQRKRPKPVNNTAPTPSHPTDTQVSTSNRFAVLEDLDNDMVTDNGQTNTNSKDPPSGTQTKILPSTNQEQPQMVSSRIKIPVSQTSATGNDAPSDHQIEDNVGFTRETRPTNRIPPITIREFGEWLLLREEIQRLCTDKFAAKTFGAEMKLQFKNITDYRAAAHLFSVRKIQHVVFHVPEEPTLRVVLKRVHDSIPLEDIKAEIESQGIEITKISRLRKAESSPASPLALIQLANHAQNKKIFHLTELLGTTIMVESFKKKNEAIQCYNCQGFGHGASSCHLNTKCVKCSLDHPSRQCNFPKERMPKCVNCLGPHVASYRGCPKFPKPRTTTATTAGNIVHSAPTFNTTSFPALGTEKGLSSISSIGSQKGLSSFRTPPAMQQQAQKFPSYAAVAQSNSRTTPNIQALLMSMAQQQQMMMTSLQALISTFHG